MSPHEDSYRPREHDHLVEPMFGGLGMEGESDAVESATAEKQTVLSRFLRFLRLR